MLNVSQAKEVVLRVANHMSVLGEVSRLISERGVSVLAVCANVEQEICTLRLVTDDNLRTCDILREHAYTPEEEPVVILEAPHKPGMLKKLTQRLGEEGVEICNIYATACLPDTRCSMVLRTTNDARALVALSEFVTDHA